MRSLPLFHRIAGQPVIVLGEGAMAEPKRRLVERAGGVPVSSEEDGLKQGARLAYVALEDSKAAAEAAARLKAAGLLVNVVDQPELCDFTTPSLLERDPVLIAIGTSGASAGLAKHIRLRLEALLPARLGALAEALSKARAAIRTRWPKPAERRLALDKALGPGGALDPLSDHADDAVESWLAGEATDGTSGRVTIVLTSADPEDLTLRQARLLGTADVLLVGDGVPDAILDRARADALRRTLGDEVAQTGGLVIELKLTLEVGK